VGRLTKRDLTLYLVFTFTLTQHLTFTLHLTHTRMLARYSPLPSPYNGFPETHEVRLEEASAWMREFPEKSAKDGKRAT
jgi:hypothetical protein